MQSHYGTTHNLSSLSNIQKTRMKEAERERARDKQTDADAKRGERGGKKQITAEAVLREMEKDKRDESKCAPS